MTRTLGAGIATDIGAATAETTELILLDFADISTGVPTPVYLTTAAKDIVWSGQTWQAVGGRLELDALGESTDGAGTGFKMNLSGVDQTVIALILGARYRGRTASVWYVHLDQAAGTVITDPVLMFVGMLNGGWDIVESRSFEGGTVDITLRLTAKVNELVRVRGVRTNLQSHQTVIPSATTDTFFQHVGLLALRKVFWGMKTPVDLKPNGAPRPLPGHTGTNLGPGYNGPMTPPAPHGGFPATAPVTPATPTAPPEHGGFPALGGR